MVMDAVSHPALASNLIKPFWVRVPELSHCKSGTFHGVISKVTNQVETTSITTDSTSTNTKKQHCKPVSEKGFSPVNDRSPAYRTFKRLHLFRDTEQIC